MGCKDHKNIIDYNEVLEDFRCFLQILEDGEGLHQGLCGGTSLAFCVVMCDKSVVNNNDWW